MQVAMIGLGRMGGNMAKRLARGGHQVVACDRQGQVALDLAQEEEGIQAAGSIGAAVSALSPPRVLWLMVPHQVVDAAIVELVEGGAQSGDIIIDGGNSNYRESQRRGSELAAKGIQFVDCGTSGGVWGLAEGYSLMLGGEAKALKHIAPLLKTLAPAADAGWGHVGPVGAGHFVKMVHNGIEYGMMQAFAEGFELMRQKKEFALDAARIARIWQHGSVVRSWLLDLAAEALAQDKELSALSDWVDDSGEGRWAVHEAVDLAVPAPVLSLALMMRFRSRQQAAFSAKVLNAMRAGFGGHAIRREGEGE